MIAMTDKIVIFRLGPDLFAAGVQSVERVLRYQRARPLPDVPQWVDGVIEYRSHVIPQLDLRRRFELPEAPAGPTTRVLVLNAGGGWVAVVVDAVLEVASYDPSQLSPPPALFRGLAGEYLKGLVRHGDRLIVLLDVDRLLSATERLRLEAATADVSANG
ncbi:MAG: chemotaxis protein CheW [Gemmatimonadaceae bacterium]